MKYYLVAGEASGDLHGANLMKALKDQDKQANFRFFGGDLMQAEGGTIVKNYADMAFMGFIEVVLNLRTISQNIKACKNDILAWQPDVLVLIDFPGFNLRIAEFAKNNGILVCYYISPKVWAWNQKRVLKIKRVVDHLFCILPFEVEFYKKWGMKVDYVGNPLLDAVAAFKPDQDFLAKNRLAGKKIVALLPGRMTRSQTGSGAPGRNSSLIDASGIGAGSRQAGAESSGVPASRVASGYSLAASTASRYRLPRR